MIGFILNLTDVLRVNVNYMFTLIKIIDAFWNVKLVACNKCNRLHETLTAIV